MRFVMPESVSGVDAILDGLRERATGWSCVPLADAVAAVLAAADARTREIVELLRDADARDGWEGTLHISADYIERVARRFPNGGTTDPERLADGNTTTEEPSPHGNMSAVSAAERLQGSRVHRMPDGKGA